MTSPYLMGTAHCRICGAFWDNATAPAGTSTFRCLDCGKLSAEFIPNYDIFSDDDFSKPVNLIKQNELLSHEVITGDVKRLAGLSVEEMQAVRKELRRQNIRRVK